MVLKAPDYAFIGLKLKGLIFLKRNESTQCEHSEVGAGICRLKMQSEPC